MAEQKRRRSKRREGYLHRSPAVCIVIHDMHGKPMPDAIATKILNVVTEIALEHQYLINFTRT